MLGSFGEDEGGAVDRAEWGSAKGSTSKEVLPFADGGFAAGVTLGFAQTYQGT